MKESLSMRKDIVQTPWKGTSRYFMRAESLLAAIPDWVPLLMLRFALAIPFFRSGLTKWDGFLQLSGGAEFLFASEFKLHIFGELYPYPFPILAAYASGLAEIVLPVLLVLGVLTRFSAFALLVMTAIIQVTVPEGWANFHLPWAAMALAIVVFGPGWLSVDAAVRTVR